MFYFKLIWHIKKFFQYFILKIIYRKKMVIGKRTTWRKNFNMLIGKNGLVHIGKNCFFNNDCSIISLKEVFIDDGSIFGENVKIYDNNHRFNKKNMLIKRQGYSVGLVSVGKNCWIGSNVVLLKGTRIGDNCVIGAGCVVNSEVNSGTVLSRSSDQQSVEIEFQ